MTCPNCEPWVAKTWSMHSNRMLNMRASPEVRPHVCPWCGGTDWATKPPNVLHEHKPPLPWWLWNALMRWLGIT